MLTTCCYFDCTSKLIGCLRFSPLPLVSGQEVDPPVDYGSLCFVLPACGSDLDWMASVLIGLQPVTDVLLCLVLSMFFFSLTQRQEAAQRFFM